jgi:methyl-accepting chemotaxis protein
MFRTLRIRFVAGCVFLILLIVAVAQISLFKANELVGVALDARLNMAEASFRAAMEQESFRAFSMAEIVARDPEVIDAFAAKDRARLLQLLSASFAELKARHGIAQAHFHLPPAISFLRLYMPDTFGDDISAKRKTVVVANETRRPARGIEPGHGGLGFRAVVPVSKDGVHLGTFEYGVSFGEVMVQQIAAAMRAGIAIYHAHDGRFDILGTTFPDSFKPSQEVLDAAMREPRSEPAVTVGDGTLAMRFVPIKDFSGTPIAVAAFGVDHYQFQEMLKSNLSRIGAATLVALLLAGGMTVAFLLAVIRPVTNLVRDMRRLADGELNVIPKGTGRKDEIGDMCRAVEVFRTNAISRQALQQALEREHRERRARQEHMKRIVAEFLSEARKDLKLLTAGAPAPVAVSAGEGPQPPDDALNRAAQDLQAKTERFLSEIKAG